MGLHDHPSCLWLRKSLPLEHSRHEREQIAIFILGQQERLGIELLFKIVLLYLSVCMSGIYLEHRQNVNNRT